MTSCQLLVAFHYIHTPTCFHYTLVNLFIVKSPFHHLETQDVLNNDEMPWNLLNFPMAFMVNSLFLMVTSPFFIVRNPHFSWWIPVVLMVKSRWNPLKSPGSPGVGAHALHVHQWRPHLDGCHAGTGADQRFGRTKNGERKSDGRNVGIYMGFIWDLYRIYMGFKWINMNYMGFIWDLNGSTWWFMTIYMGFLGIRWWYSYPLVNQHS